MGGKGTDIDQLGKIAVAVIETDGRVEDGVVRLVEADELRADIFGESATWIDTCGG